MAYVAGLAARNTQATSPWPRTRTVCFMLGVATMVLALDGGVAVYGGVLFWIHMVQHLMLIMIVPALLAFGRPLTLAQESGESGRRASAALLGSPVTALTFPAATVVLYTVVLAGVHLSDFMQAMMLHPWLGDLEHTSYLLSGYLLFSPLLTRDPTRFEVPYLLRLVILMIAMTADTVVGVVLIQTPLEPWPAYAAVHPSWAAPLLDDVHAGGALMWIGGDGLMFAMVLIVLFQWISDTRPEARGAGRWLESVRQSALANTLPSPGGGDAILNARDVDADEDALAAYNAMLSRLNGHRPRR
ncbi:cytochrome c oxidase assembly protein [Microbispora sp. ATCC PTA-5024]|uniref:cytochrome c oxidase assembly protein n=1 Tax=Microbispora sp. ATCC PTA-5024 TaxID=316330 RepID=UPI0012ECF2D5|nr:cytochrome c oxidase assembly protein [Microbispora sp. ATCC PTA-5024]